MADVDKWVYSAVVKDHFMHPKGFLLGEPKEGDFDSYGEVGSLACGDIIKVWIKVDKETDKIKDFKWQTWGMRHGHSLRLGFRGNDYEKQRHES